MRLIEIPDDGFIRVPIMSGKDTVGERRIDLSDFPTVDAVPVVRCKDCHYGSYDSKIDDAMVCKRTNDGYWRHGSDFCSYGRLKEHE